MAINEWTFCPLRGLTVVRTSGNITTDDLSEWAVRFRMGAVTESVLWDITRADISKLSADEICTDEQKTVDCTDLRNVSKVAIVSVNGFEYGLAELLSAFCGDDDMPFEVQVFKSFDEAIKWLVVRPNPAANSPCKPTAGHEVFHSTPTQTEDPSHIGEVDTLR